MRLFIGIDLNDEEKSYLKKVQDKVKYTAVSGTFTHFNNFHITLKYIGHTTSEEVDELMDILDEVSASTTSFPIKIGDVGEFHKKNHSIIWVGITRGIKKLSTLYQKIEHSCINAGFEPEGRKYRPHITLGKKIVFTNGHNIVDIPYYPNDVKVNTLTLFESKRIDGILTYTPIYQVDLT